MTTRPTIRIATGIDHFPPEAAFSALSPKRGSMSTAIVTFARLVVVLAGRSSGQPCTKVGDTVPSESRHLGQQCGSSEGHPSGTLQTTSWDGQQSAVLMHWSVSLGSVVVDVRVELLVAVVITVVVWIVVVVLLVVVSPQKVHASMQFISMKPLYVLSFAQYPSSTQSLHVDLEL